MGILQAAGKVGKAVVNFTIGGVKKFISNPSIKTAPAAALDVASIALPAAKVTKVAKIGGLLSKATSYVGKIANQPITQKAGKILGFGSAVGLGSYAATGKLPEMSARSVAGYAAMQVNPYGAIYGVLSGGAQELLKKAQSAPNILDAIKGQKTGLPVSYPQSSIFEQYKDVPNLFPNIPSTIRLEGAGFTSLPTPSISVQSPQSPAFAPSVSLSGSGMGEILPLLLLLGGGAGVAGYMIGKKKKRKKYKKKKRY